MKPIFIFCLIAASFAMAQRQSVVVLPSIADPEAKLSPRELDLLTENVRSIIPNILPLKDFNLLKQDVVKERLGEEGLFLACKEGSCVGDLVARVQTDFGARCEVLKVNKQLYLKFELYGTLKGESEAGTIDQFNDPVRDFAAMLVLINEKVPASFKKIVAEPIAVQVPVSAVPAVSGNVVARIATEPAGAVLEVNGMPYQGCSETPCVISLYENRFKLSAVLANYETADTNLVITVPNQLVTIKLKPITYSVNFTSQPSGAFLSFGGKSYPNCRQTPCNTRFTRGNVKVTAGLNMHETKDTTIFVWQNDQRIDLKLFPNYEALRVSSGIDEDEIELNKPVAGSFWVALALDVIGVVVLGIGVVKDGDVEDNYVKYSEVRQYGRQSDIDSAWEKADEARTARNTFYVVGSLFLAAGIGVHIWF